MHFKYKQFTIQQNHAAMKVGTDSDLLGTMAAGGSRILDIGTGTGIISLMMAQRFPQAEIEAIEIDDDAVRDARVNFETSPFGNRIKLLHASFQEFLSKHGGMAEHARPWDCIVCNPPYFDKSKECPTRGRTRARHTSSLPFETLISGAYSLLSDEGVFSVCIPPEVLNDFTSLCIIEGFWPLRTYRVRSLPSKPPKRYVLVFSKSRVLAPETHDFCMRNADHSRSDWYMELMKDFLVDTPNESCL